jgi:excisionase family DNA binding protein
MDTVHNEQENVEAGVENKKVVSITEAARINNVTRQAIYVAIKLKKLRAKKDSTRWTIDLEDLEEYRSNKYSRTKSTFNGELLFDSGRGLYSVKQVADIMGVPAQKIYYAIRSKSLPAEQKGAAWVIRTEDVEKYKMENAEKKKTRIRKAS